VRHTPPLAPSCARSSPPPSTHAAVVPHCPPPSLGYPDGAAGPGVRWGLTLACGVGGFEVWRDTIWQDSMEAEKRSWEVSEPVRGTPPTPPAVWWVGGWVGWCMGGVERATGRKDGRAGGTFFFAPVLCPRSSRVVSCGVRCCWRRVVLSAPQPFVRRSLPAVRVPGREPGRARVPAGLPVPEERQSFLVRACGDSSGA
jgi:hypothetical protein